MRYGLLLCLLLASCAGMNYPDGHGGTGHDDSNVANSLTSLNPTSGTYGDVNYPGQLYNSLSKEDANRYSEQGFANLVSVQASANACLGATGVGLTMTPSSCIAYNAGYRGTETGSITFSNSSTCWVAMDENTSGGNAGLGGNWTRAGATHYLVDCIDTTQPTMVSDSQILMKVVTSGGSITGVTDLRNKSAIGVGPVCYPAQQAGATADVQINACIAAVPSGGTVDASSIILGTLASGSTITINKTIKLILPNALTYSGAANTSGIFQIAAGGGGSDIGCLSYFDANGLVRGCSISYAPSAGSASVLFMFPNTTTAVTRVTFHDFTVITGTHAGDVFQNQMNSLAVITVRNVSVLPVNYNGSIVAPASYTGSQGWLWENTGNAASSETDSMVFDGVYDFGTLGGISLAGSNETTNTPTIKNSGFDGIAGGMQNPEIIIGSAAHPASNFTIAGNLLFRANPVSASSAIEVQGSGVIVNNNFSQNNFRNEASPNTIGDISYCNTNSVVKISTNNLTGGLNSMTGPAPYTDPDNGIAECADGTAISGGPAIADIEDNGIANYFISGIHLTQSSKLDRYLTNHWAAGSGGASVEADISGATCSNTVSCFALSELGGNNQLQVGNTITVNGTTGQINLGNSSAELDWGVSNASKFTLSGGLYIGGSGTGTLNAGPATIAGALSSTGVTSGTAAAISGGGTLSTGSNAFAGRITGLAATSNVLTPGFTCANAVTATFQDDTTAGGVKVTAQNATTVTFSATASDTADYITGCR